MARREFTKRVQRYALLRADGRCEGPGCGAKLSLGKYHYDHVNPDGLTGEPTLENCAVLCVVCHKDKTRRDVGMIARAKRREDANLGIRDPHRRKIVSRGFERAQPQRSATRPLERQS